MTLVTHYLPQLSVSVNLFRPTRGTPLATTDRSAIAWDDENKNSDFVGPEAQEEEEDAAEELLPSDIVEHTELTSISKSSELKTQLRRASLDPATYIL